jgi:hypothetical protein
MKTRGSVIERCMVLSLSMIYLLIALTYILYLPKYNALRTVNNYTNITTLQVLNPIHPKENNVGNMLVLLHGVFKSSIENKQDTRSILSQSFLILASFILGGIILFYPLRKSSGYIKLPRSPQYAYLGYCVLRI